MISSILVQKIVTARRRLDEYIRFGLVWRRQIWLAVFLALVYYFLEVNGSLKSKFFLDSDIAHINAQFFLATIVGGYVALSYRNWENRRALEKQVQDKEREIRGLNRAALVEFYRSTNDLQNEFKKIRRSLRAASFVDEAGERWIERGDFECLMDRFEDCQLRAESLYRQAKARGELFGFEVVRESDGDEDTSLEVNSDDPGTLVRLNLYNTKRYFRKAVRPYERNFLERRALTPKELLAIRDGALKEFIDPPRANPNSKPVPDPMDTVRTNLLKMISDSGRNSRP